MGIGVCVISVNVISSFKADVLGSKGYNFSGSVYNERHTYMNLFSGVFTHFHGTLPAATCDQPGKAFTAELVGAASEDEVVIMNGLSVNLVREDFFLRT